MRFRTKRRQTVQELQCSRGRPGRCPAFPLLLGLLALPNLYLVLAGVEFEGKSLAIRGYFLLAAVVFLALPLLVAPAGRYALLLGLLGLLAPFELLHVHWYGGAATVGALGSTLESTGVEMKEFFAGKLLHLAGALIFVTLMLLLTWRARRASTFDKTLALRIAALVAVVLGAGLIQKALVEDLGVRRGAVELCQNLQRSFQMSFPYGFVGRLAVAADGVWQASRHRTLTATFRFNAVRSTSASAPEIYVTIIGETQRFANWSVNGYNRETAPRLARIAHLTSFDHVCSPSNLSRVSVPLILTRVGTERYREVNREKSYLAAFAEVGFRTYWISNQGKFGTHDNSTSMHAAEADETFFLGLERGGYDGRVLPVLRQLLAREERQVMILIHTTGSHYDYSSRYPREAAVFLPDGASNSGTRETLLNSYDNSIAYADGVIAAIIAEVDARDVPAVVTFISDHGENLGDDSRKLYGHPTPHNTSFEYHVPFFVWLSDEYRGAYPEKSRAIALNRSKWATGSGFFHTITDLASIECDGRRVESSLAQSGYQEQETTVVDANGRFLDCRTLK